MKYLLLSSIMLAFISCGSAPKDVGNKVVLINPDQLSKVNGCSRLNKVESNREMAVIGMTPEQALVGDLKEKVLDEGGNVLVTKKEVVNYPGYTMPGQKMQGVGYKCPEKVRAQLHDAQDF